MTTLDTTAGQARPTTWRDSWRFPVLVFLGVLAVLLVVVQVSHDHLSPEHPQTGPDISDEAFYGGWMQYDTGWYVYLAEHGYDQHHVAEFKSVRMSAVAYFPAYPLVVEQVARVANDDPGLAAELTTAACGLAVMVLFWLWCGRRLSPAARRTSLLLVALYPYAWFLYGSGYGDALFIALTLGAMLLLERDRPVLAGVAGAFASASRLIGVGTVIGLVAITLQRREAIVRTAAADGDPPRRWWSGWRLDRTRLRGRDAGVLLGFAGVASYCVFLYARTGDFLAWNTVQSAPGWNQGTGPKTWIKYSFFAEVLRGSPGYGVRLVIQALLCLAFVIAIPFVFKRFGYGYAVYTAVILAIPLVGSSSFMGFGRYLLAAFPVFALGGEVLAERTTPRRIVLGTSALGLLVLASFFGRGFYLS